MFNTIMDKLINATFIDVFASMSTVAALIKLFGII